MSSDLAALAARVCLPGHGSKRLSIGGASLVDILNDLPCLLNAFDVRTCEDGHKRASFDAFWLMCCDVGVTAHELALEGAVATEITRANLHARVMPNVHRVDLILTVVEHVDEFVCQYGFELVP